MRTWNQLVEEAKAEGRRVVVSLLAPYFCPDTGGKFKRGQRFNVDPNGELWLKDGKSIKWQYEAAIVVNGDNAIPTQLFFIEA